MGTPDQYAGLRINLYWQLVRRSMRHSTVWMFHNAPRTFASDDFV